MTYKFLILLSCISFYFGSVASAAMRPFPSGERLGLIYLRGRETNEVILKNSLADIYSRGFRRIVIPYWGCQPSIESNEVGACEVVPASTFLLQAKIAKNVGLGVSFLPIVATPAGDWRGLFKPQNPDRWFQTYGAWIKKIGREARDLGMTELVVGTEFSQYIYNQTDHWKKLLKEVRAEAFSGSLIVTVNWDHPEFKFWSEADAIGISAYFPLEKTKRNSSSLEQMAITNRETMKRAAKKAGKPLFVVEFGFASLKTAAKKPWHYPVPPEVPELDLALQARCYGAFLKAWEGDSELIGLNAWATSDPASVEAATSFEMLGKPAEAVIKGFL